MSKRSLVSSLAVCATLSIGGAVNALDTTLFTVVGAAAFLGAGYRVPLAAVMFVAEATGRPGFIVPGLIAAVVAELIMGRSSVTTYQYAATEEVEGAVEAPAEFSIGAETPTIDGTQSDPPGI